MSKELKDLQTAPTLTLNPFQEEAADRKIIKEEPLMNENVLSEEEREDGRSVCKSD